MFIVNSYGIWSIEVLNFPTEVLIEDLYSSFLYILLFCCCCCVFIQTSSWLRRWDEMLAVEVDDEDYDDVVVNVYTWLLNGFSYMQHMYCWLASSFIPYFTYNVYFIFYFSFPTFSFMPTATLRCKRSIICCGVIHASSFFCILFSCLC